MRRTFYFAALAATLALVAGPAVADHVSEPTIPITGMTLRLYKYQELPSTLLTACDGSEEVTFANLRVESLVTASGIGSEGNPSEHYHERLKLEVITQLGQPQQAEKYQWDVEWKHSNIPPHASQVVGSPVRTWESSQTNQRILGVYPSGTVLRFTEVLTTLESEQQFVSVCTFTVG